MKPLLLMLIALTLPSAGCRRGKSDLGIQWVSLPGGEFTMGWGSDDWTDSKPLHQVKVPAFELAKTPVTNRQYRACVDSGGCAPTHIRDGTCSKESADSDPEEGSSPERFLGDDQPVVCIDFNQAAAFARWAGGRLPTEAEWEYAARSAGKNWKFPWGNEAPSCARADLHDASQGCRGTRTQAVCSKPQGNTQQGLCDMVGNTFQWTQDVYQNSYAGAPVDGSAVEDPSTSARRVYRGGFWAHQRPAFEATIRLAAAPDYTTYYLGMRLAR